MDIFNDGGSYNKSSLNSLIQRVKNLKSKLLNISKLFNDYTYKNNKRVKTLVNEVNTYTNKYKKIHDEDFLEFANNKTNEFRKLLREGHTIESIMCDALSVAREATRRGLGKFPYDVQIEAAIAMIGNTYNVKNGRNNETKHENIIAEMKTGEGKTLVQILVSYLNALEATKDEDKSKWKSVHIMTSNDALAKRDATDNEKVFNILGLSCGFVPSRKSYKGLSPEERKKVIDDKKEAYTKDIVYATMTTIAYDYLDDNTVLSKDDKTINKPFGYAVIDEADDILIDQAINPLILSGSLDSSDSEFNELIKKRELEDRKLYKWATEFLYGNNSKNRELTFTLFDQYDDAQDKTYQSDYAFIKDTGDIILSKRLESELSSIFDTDRELYYSRYFALLNCISARHAFLNGREYLVEYNQENDTAKVVLVDENTGRKKTSSKYRNGMQEAIEAKEAYLHQKNNNRYKIEYSRPTVTKAMCTYPDFLSIYESGICGMTGTSDIEEFRDLYGFETYKVDTRKKNIRVDSEYLYATKKRKYNAIIKEVKKCHKLGRPVLIGTSSIKESEEISKLLSDNYIKHETLNAEHEEIENKIISTAGLFGSVTVSTNMAGRGTDIKLGEGVRELGGLMVIATSNNKSKRIDNQLKGRAARQGDPGETKYFTSLEDDLVLEQYQAPNGKNRLEALIELYDEDEPITNNALKKAVSRCQELRESKDKYTRQVNEKFNYSYTAHRNLLYKERDSVLNASEKEVCDLTENVISEYSNYLVNKLDVSEIKSLIGHMVNVDDCYNDNKLVFKESIKDVLIEKFKKNNFESLKNIRENTIREYLNKQKNPPIEEIKKEVSIRQQNYINSLRKKYLHVIDTYWISHITELEDIRLSNTVGVADDPLKSFQIEANNSFYNVMFPNIYNEMITYAVNPNLKYGEYIIQTNNSENNFIEEENLSL